MSESVRENNIKIVQQFFTALNAWDIDTIQTLTTDDILLEVPFKPIGFERATKGQPKYLELLKQASTVMIDGSENLHEFELDTFASDPNRVIATYKSDMKMRSGAQYRNEYVSMFRLRDGKICHFVEYLDSILLHLALGGKVDGMQDLEDKSLLPELLGGS